MDIPCIYLVFVSGIRVRIEGSSWHGGNKEEAEYPERFTSLAGEGYLGLIYTWVRRSDFILSGDFSIF